MHNKFSFLGQPEKVQIECLGEGFKVILDCDNIDFNLDNLKGKLKGEIVWFTTDESLIDFNGCVKLEGIITSPNSEQKRTLVALKKANIPAELL